MKKKEIEDQKNKISEEEKKNRIETKWISSNATAEIQQDKEGENQKRRIKKAQRNRNGHSFITKSFFLLHTKRRRIRTRRRRRKKSQLTKKKSQVKNKSQKEDK